jgi:NADPH-dependent 2,4-dienoyl-CoA reductase/sulfur reductase-like enzyme
MKRRALLQAAAALAATPFLARAATAQQVVVVGGGWGGLAAARALRELAPQLEVTLLERNSEFRSQPLSNRWLAGLAPEALLRHDYRQAAQRWGYRFVATEVLEIDRAARKIATSAGRFGYDWLILAPGIREDFSPWYGVDREAAAFTRRRFASAFAAAGEQVALKARLENFKGGDLVMTIPPMPYRCPPAPYERAGLIAWWMKRRGIKGRLLVLDPNQPALGFDRIYRDSFRDQITYLPQARIRSIDPYRQQLITEFETIDFAEAILAPPQQAADLAWQAGLVAGAGDGKPSAWAEHDPVTLQAAGDERVFLAGDVLDRSSPLFGFYPKTGELAARLGRIAATQVAARAAGGTAERQLPQSTCYVIARPEPLETMRLETTFRWRGDGLIQQTVRQSYNPQAADEDIDWARRMFAELGFAPGA